MLRITKKIYLILNEKNKNKTFLIGFLMLIGAIMESLGVSLIMPLMTSIIGTSKWDETWYGRIIAEVFNLENQTAYLHVLLMLLMAVYIIKNLYLIMEYHTQFTFIAKCRYDMQQKLMHKYIYRSYAYFLDSSTGEIVRVISSDTNQTTNILTNLLTFYTEIIVCAVLIATVFIISFRIALFLAVVLIIELLVITFVLKPIMTRFGDIQRKETAATNKWVLQAITGIKSIKVSNTEEFFEKKYSKHATQVIQSEIRSQTLSNLPRLIIEACTVSAVLLLFMFSLSQGTELSALFPQMSAFLVAAVRLLPSVNRISSIMAQTPYLEGGLDSVVKNMDEKENLDFIEKRYCSEGSETSKNQEKEGTVGEVILKEITYAYPNSCKKVLNSANMSIHKGQSIGIIGASGAGKTTAVDIMLGLLYPQEGQVIANGEDIKENYDSWLGRLAYIPQQIFLMDDTIRANVAFGFENEKICDEKVWEVLEEAQLKDYVESMPEGIYSHIGEQGIRLSGGQRQRIGIARALYRNPEILFFDEATSALDNETECAIMESIENLKGRKTLIIIAHRLTTIQNCDVIYKVEEGKIIKQ